MPSEHIRLHVVDGHVELLRDEAAKAGGVEDAGHTDDTLPRELAHLESQLRHRIQRIADDDQRGVGRAAHQFLGHAPDDVHVGLD